MSVNSAGARSKAGGDPESGNGRARTENLNAGYYSRVAHHHSRGTHFGQAVLKLS